MDNQEMMPPGYVLWGNYGDGKWRVSPPYDDQGNVITPTNNKNLAIHRAWKHYNLKNREMDKTRNTVFMLYTNEHIALPNPPFRRYKVIIWVQGAFPSFESAKAKARELQVDYDQYIRVLEINVHNM